MSEPLSFLQESLESLRPDLSGPVQAQLAIPLGMVRTVRRTFEDRISRHVYQEDMIYINRAIRNMDELIRQNRTYAEQLRLAECATLFNLPVDLADFLRDHDNLYRAAIRSRQVANQAVASLDVDVFVQVACRMQNIRNVYYVNLIEETRSPAEYRRLKHDPLFTKEFDECTSALQDEIVSLITRLERLLPSPDKDMDLENVGADHNVNEYGHDVSAAMTRTTTEDRDHSQRCCICLEGYTTTHMAFAITECKHIVGKPCLSTWLNGTSKNANLCPHCRTSLCERRARRPAGITAAIIAEQREINDRLERAIFLMEDVEKLYDEQFGTDSAVEMLKKAMDALNYQLFENDIGFA